MKSEASELLGLPSSHKIFLIDYERLNIPAWNQTFVIRFENRIEGDAVCCAIKRLLLENDGLRMRILSEGGEFKAYFADEIPKEIPIYNFVTDEEMDKLAESFASETIDFSGALIRFAVCQVEEHTEVLFSAHHIICDGYTAFLVREKLTGYLKDGKPGENPAGSSIDKKTCKALSHEKRNYREHLREHEKYQASPRYEKDREYWNAAIRKDDDLRLYLSGGMINDYSSGNYGFSVEPETADRIRALAAEQGVSLQTFFYAVLSVFLLRTGDKDRFAIGMPVLGRISGQDLDTPGLYINTVPVVIDSPWGSFESLLDDIFEKETDCFRHGRFSQWDIMKELNEGNSERGLLFDVTADYMPFGKSGAAMEVIPGPSLTTALEIHFYEQADGSVSVLARYRKCVIKRSDMEDMENAFRTMTDQVLNDPKTDIRHLPIYSAEAIRESFARSGGPIRPLPDNAVITHMFLENAEKHPDHVCIRTVEREYTYGEFLKDAKKIASGLRSLGIGPREIVGVMIERSYDMLLAIYGVLLNGDCYVPIKPDHPEERRNGILKDAGASFLITDVDFLREKGEKREYEAPHVSMEDAAYIIYTSGSTGEPKGAQVSHGAAVNRIRWMYETYMKDKAFTLMQKTPFTFDVSVWEIFLWGLYDGEVFVLPEGAHMIMPETLRCMDSYGVTHAHFVPSVFRIFTEYLKKHQEDWAKLGKLEHVFLSGEQAEASVVRDFLRLMDRTGNHIRIHNLYGPAECAVDVTYYDIKGDEEFIPIGKPIDNTEILILDRFGNMLPEGRTGEILIAGRNVGMGYINRDDLTRKKFTPRIVYPDLREAWEKSAYASAGSQNSEGKRSGPEYTGRMYHTGDLGKWNEKGEILFLGRNDGQLKLAGQRVEPMEISTSAAKRGLVRDAVCIAEKEQGAETLIMICTSELTEDEIKAQMAKYLPAYMIPKKIWIVDALPVSSHGKTDLKKLRELASLKAEALLDEKPENEEERAICALFGQRLGLKNYGRNRDFIASGGSSLDVVYCLADDIFDKISLDEFCEDATPAALAKKICRKNGVDPAEPLGFRSLVPLYEASEPKKFVIAFSYAGGSVMAFRKLAERFRNGKASASLYYMGWGADRDQALHEILELGKMGEVVFYAHCAGNMLALMMADRINRANFSEADRIDSANFSEADRIDRASRPEEKTEGALRIGTIISGGCTPPDMSKPVRDPWEHTPDTVLSFLLKKAGLKTADMGKKEKELLIRTFRENAREYIDYFRQLDHVIDCRLCPVYSSKDIFTRNYKQSRELWSRVVREAEESRVYDWDSHYFQDTESETIYGIINEITEG